MVNSWEQKWSGLEGRFGNRVMYMYMQLYMLVKLNMEFGGGGGSFPNFVYLINAQNIEHI